MDRIVVAILRVWLPKFLMGKNNFNIVNELAMEWCSTSQLMFFPERNDPDAEVDLRMQLVFE